MESPTSGTPAGDVCPGPGRGGGRSYSLQLLRFELLGAVVKQLLVHLHEQFQRVVYQAVYCPGSKARCWDRGRGHRPPPAASSAPDAPGYANGPAFHRFPSAALKGCCFPAPCRPRAPALRPVVPPSGPPSSKYPRPCSSPSWPTAARSLLTRKLNKKHGTHTEDENGNILVPVGVGFLLISFARPGHQPRWCSGALVPGSAPGPGRTGPAALRPRAALWGPETWLPQCSRRGDARGGQSPASPGTRALMGQQ